MKKLKLLVITLVMVLSLSACVKDSLDKLADTLSSSGQKTENRDAKATEALTPTAAPSLTATPEPTATTAPTATPTSEATPTPTATPVPTEEITPEPVQNITNTITPADDALLKDIFEAYTEFLGKNVDDKEYDNLDTLRFGLAFIDDDNIPELIAADYPYHAAGVRVVFYNNGNLKEVGEFGEYGGFAYAKFNNRILSYYMGMGIQCLSQLHVDDTVTAVVDFTMEGDINENKDFFINDKEVDIGEFDRVYNNAFDGDDDHPIIWVTYEALTSYYPNLCQGMHLEIFSDMYEKLLNPGYERYTGYVDPKMEAMKGTWALKTAEVHMCNPSYDFIYNGDAIDDGEMTCDYYMTSEAYIFDYAGFWLSAYGADGNTVDELTLSSYSMPMSYFNGGISEGIDYGWCVVCEPQDGLQWDCDMCLDDDDHLIVVLYKDTGDTYEMDGAEYPLMDDITLTYERVFYDYDYNTATAAITRSAKDDIDGKYAFLAEEYVFIYPDQPDLIAEYGLPKDLDGNDYEIVKSKKEPYIFYVDEHTVIKVINWETLDFDRVPVEDFAESRMYNEYYIYFDGVNEDGNNEGLTAAALYQDYIG